MVQVDGIFIGIRVDISGKEYALNYQLFSTELRSMKSRPSADYLTRELFAKVRDAVNPVLQEEINKYEDSNTQTAKIFSTSFADWAREVERGSNNGIK